MSGTRTDALATATAATRFLLELAALAVLGYWGFHAGDGAAGIALGVGIPLAVAAVWAAFGSPAAPYRLGSPWRVGLEVAIFGAAALAVYDLWGALHAGGFAGVAAVNTVLLYALGDAE